MFILALLCASPSWANNAPDLTPAQAALAAYAPTATRTIAARPPVTTERRTTLAGRTVVYRASVGEWPVRSPDGTIVGVVVTESYVVPSLAGAKRPVTIVYNGGPGASSWPLQMEGIGPQRYDASSGTFTDNPDSLLDVTDLVFVDPLGTGASFPLAGQDASAVWNTRGDARSIIGVVDGWRRANKRSDAPVYLLGESYGTLRNAAILHADAETPRLNIAGVVMLSMFLATHVDADIEAINRLPSLAAAAYAHGARRVPAASAEQAYADALRFARTQYAAALQEGSALSQEDTHAVAEAMSDQIGVPASVLEDAHLRIDRRAFAHALALPVGGTHVGSLDARIVGSKEIDGLQDPYSDPAMTLGKRSPLLMERYLSGLGYTMAGSYRPLNLSINQDWTFAAPTVSEDGSGEGVLDVVPWLVEAMTANPRLRLFTAGGYFDTVTPYALGEYQLNHSEIARSRWTAHAYPAGHGIAEDLPQRARLAADLRAFIAGAH
jgi:carboxypeptidase C (cathepsin A)